jgi:hypothetical protein
MVLAGPQRAPCLGRPSPLDKDFRLARVEDNLIDSVEKIGGNSKWNYPMTGGSPTAFTGQKWAIRDEAERLISLLSSMTILVGYLTPSSISPEYLASYLRALEEALLTRPGGPPRKIYTRTGGAFRFQQEQEPG